MEAARAGLRRRSSSATAPLRIATTKPLSDSAPTEVLPVVRSAGSFHSVLSSGGSPQDSRPCMKALTREDKQAKRQFAEIWSFASAADTFHPPAGPQPRSPPQDCERAAEKTRHSPAPRRHPRL